MKEIHLFDDDVFLQHNAFRCPGALGLDELPLNTPKVEHYASRYSKFRHGVVAHPYRITAENAQELSEMQFVFLCLDSGEHKDAIMAFLESAGVPFIDVGMGVHERDAGLVGILRVTTSTPAKREHVRGGFPPWWVRFGKLETTWRAGCPLCVIRDPLAADCRRNTQLLQAEVGA